MGQPLPPTDLLAQMNELMEQPIPAHASLIKEIGTYFWETEAWLIDPTFVIEFSSYIHKMYNRMVEMGASSTISSAALTVVGKVSHQCGKINSGIRDAEYYSDFKVVARLLETISNNII